VLVSDGDRLAGAILLRDHIRAGIRQAVGRLAEMGIGHTIMLTGDRRAAAEAIAREIGIHEIEADLLPEQKLDHVRRMRSEGRTVAMLGDGINDAPALAAADVGVAVAGASDIAAEAAGVVYMPHSLDRLPQLFEVSQRAMHTAWLNIVLFAGAFNALAVLACATGKLGPIGAACTHQLSSFCVMMNSLRLLRVERPARPRAASIAQDAWRRASAFDSAAALRWVLQRRASLVGPAVITAAALAALSGFYAIQADEVGVIERFGRKVTPFSQPGLHYKLPWPIERLTRIRAHRVRVLEIGFRSNAGAAAAEPSAYEWNVQHRSGRFQSRPEESLMLTGDQNMIELNASVHFEIAQPDAFLFRQMDGDETIRQAAESVIQGVTTTTPLDEVLTSGRQALEQQVLGELQRRMDRYQTGIHVLRVKLEDVHPSLEVVDAFRDVSAAFEEKNRLVNEAEGYRNEQVALARGNAEAALHNARAYTAGRVNRAAGDAGRFTQAEQAYRAAPGPTATRLYLETIDQILPGKRKLIMDTGKGRRHLLLLEDGVEIAPAGAALVAPQPAPSGGK
jgi:HflK protein